MKNKKVAWITGGGTGIGSELTKRLVAKGWDVIISGRRIKKLKEVQNFKKSNIHVYSLDITSEKECNLVFNKIKSLFKKIDLIVLNAASYNPGHLNFEKTDSIKNVINTNLIGQINCLKYVLFQMKIQGFGQIVFISSPAGFRGLPNSGIYGVTKSALTFLAESLYLELQNKNIFVQVVHPGFVKTPMTDKNEFFMPFLMSSEEAARRIFNGIFSKKFEISFPKRLIIPMKLLRILPNSLYFFLMKKFLKNIKKQYE